MTREQTRKNYDRLSRWYDRFAGSEKVFTELGLQTLAAQEGERVLEIGFGTGHALAALAQQTGACGLAAGVELSPGMIAAARKRWQAEGQGRGALVVQGDAMALPFPAATFDAVFLSFTLELFIDEEIPSVLGECRRTLKPSGRLGVVCLAKGRSLACRLYEWGHARWPSVLDCRPIHAGKWLEQAGFDWQPVAVRKMWGLPVEIGVGRMRCQTAL